MEALASGTPVIALDEGGVRDTVTPVSDDGSAVAHATGVFFEEPTPDALRAAVVRFERETFDPLELAEAARPFSRPRFVEAMRAEVARTLTGEPSGEAVA